MVRFVKVDGRKLSHAQLEAIRFRAVEAVQAGQTPTAVARELGVYAARVFVWLASYRAGGWDALRARKASGRPKRLTGPQLGWIYQTVTSKNPMQLQFPFALWTRAMIRTLIQRKYGIKLSIISVGRLLAQMGLTCQKPLSRAFEQDATLVEKWIERDFPKLRALAKKERAVVFFADESGVRSDFHAGTTWGIRGETPVIRHTGKRFHLNMLSAISAKGELRFMTSRKRISAGLFIEFLRRLITNYPKKIFLVVDGLPAHKAKSVRFFLDQVKDRLRLFFLPPYSPEINPDELVWNDVKNNGVGRISIRTPRDLDRAVNSRLRLLQKNPEKVRAFFQMDTTRYAAVA
jgi:transposase